MKLTRGNVSQAAKLLGIHRTTLYSRMESLQKQYGCAVARPHLLATEASVRTRGLAYGSLPRWNETGKPGQPPG